MYINVGNSVQDYIQDVMQGVAEGVRGELKRSIFIGPGGVHIFGNGEPHAEEEEKVDFVKVAGIMSALGHEHRLKILNELMSGGKYINELQERLSEITTSTLSSHLNVLEDAGLVVQEKVRGRYLITIPGRTAYKTARRLARGFEESEQQ
jgi:DNA-binding HxlR family transcriptional regulator